MLKRVFPVAEFGQMREALLQHVAHVESRLGGHEKVLQLAQLLDLLEYIPWGSHAPGDRWVAADILHEILVEAIKRHKGRMSFADDVVTMLAATQAYEVFLDRQSFTPGTVAA
jgi:hypothetical protein